MSANGMKRKRTNHVAQMRAEYDFDYSKAVRGKYYKRLLAEGSNVVVLDRDIAKAFPNSASVNKALRAMLRGKRQTRAKRTRARAARAGERGRWAAPIGMKKSAPQKNKSPSQLIDARIKELGDWRGKTLARMRELIREAVPDVVEEWKWMGTPVWSQEGIICTGESYKSVVKLTFAKGVSLKDPARLFNSSLDGNVRRAIDIREGEEVDEAAFKALVREAVALNGAGKSKPAKKTKS